MEEAAPPGEVDVDNKDELIRSAGTDMPIGSVVVSFPLELFLAGMGIGTDDDDDEAEEAAAAVAVVVVDGEANIDC